MKTLYAPIQEKFSLIVSLFFILISAQVIGANINSVQSGDWKDKSTWDCNCTPKPNDDVTIKNNHVVDISKVTRVNNLIIEQFGVLNVADSKAKFVVAGDWQNDGIYVHGNNSTEFAGNNNQTIKGSERIVLNDMEVNMTGNSGALFVETPVEVDGKMNLVKGHVKTTEQDRLKINASGSMTDGSDASYIDGPVYIETDDIKQIVVGTGKNGKGKKTSINTGSNDPSLFMVEYVDYEMLASNSSPELENVCTQEYWRIERVLGYAPASVTIFMDQNSACTKITNKKNKTVAKFNGIEWENAGVEDATNYNMTTPVLESFGEFSVATTKDSQLIAKKSGNEDTNDILDNNDLFRISSFPSPATRDNINIEISGITSNPIQVQIIDLMGKQYFYNEYEPIDGKLTIKENSPDNYDQGVYLIIASSGGETYKQKLIIQ